MGANEHSAFLAERHEKAQGRRFSDEAPTGFGTLDAEDFDPTCDDCRGTGEGYGFRRCGLCGGSGEFSAKPSPRDADDRAFDRYEERMADWS